MCLFLGFALALGGAVVWLSACNSQQGMRRQFGSSVRPVYGDVGRLLKNAHYFQLMGKPELAIHELEEAFHRDPQNLRVLDALAQCYDELGEFKRAQELYRAGLKAEPDNQALTNNLCYSLYLSGKYREAEKCFREVLAQQPNNETVRNNLGLLLTRVGRQEEAMSLWQEKDGAEGAKKKMTQVLAAIRHEKSQPQAEPEKAQVAKAQSQAKSPEALAAAAPPGPQPATPPPVQTAALPASKITPEPRKGPDPAAAVRPVEAKPLTAAEAKPAAPPAAVKPAEVGAAPPKPKAPLPTTPPPLAEAAAKPAAPAKDAVSPESPGAQAAKPSTPQEVKKASVTAAHIGPASSRPALAAADTRLEVLNGNGVRRLAGQTGRWLNREGFNVLQVRNYDAFDLKETVIYCRPEAQETAYRLSNMLAQPALVKVDPGLASEGVDIRMVLGRSHTSAASLWAGGRPAAALAPVAAVKPEKPVAPHVPLADEAKKTAAPAAKAPEPEKESTLSKKVAAGLPEKSMAQVSKPAVLPAPQPLATPSRIMARPIRLTAEDLINTRIELRNGSGFKDVARQNRTLLTREGFNVVAIANHIDFGKERTVINYRPGAEKVAQALCDRFFPGAELRLQDNLSGEVDVKVILGHDLKARLEQLASLAE
jgi:thioredoxin-like negative regulator of GroEL